MENKDFIMDLSEDNAKHEEALKVKAEKEIAELDLNDAPAEPAKSETAAKPEPAKPASEPKVAVTPAQMNKAPIVADVPEGQKQGNPVMVYVMAGILVVLIIVAIVLAIPLL